jgi:hypothetical protein
MNIIPINNDSFVTSLYITQSHTNETLVVVGQKIHPPLHEINQIGNMISPRVEIVNLDNKRLEHKRILNHTYYVNYDSFIYDAIIPNGSDICLTIVKNIETNEPDTKVFLWDYPNLSIIKIHDFDHHIEEIIPDPKDSNRFLIMSQLYAAIWTYSRGKKKLVLEYVIEKDVFLINSCFISFGNESLVVISKKENQVEIYNSKNEIFRVLNLNYFIKFINESNETNITFFRRQDSRHDEGSPEIQSKKYSSEFYSHVKVNESFRQVINITPLNKKESFVIAKGKYLFVFILGTEIYLVFEVSCEPNEEDCFTLLSTNSLQLNQDIPTQHLSNNIFKLPDKTHFSFSPDFSKVIINIGKPLGQFMDNFNKAKRSVFTHHKEKKAQQANDMIQKKNVESLNTTHELDRVSMVYLSFDICYEKGSPMLKYSEEILPHTGIGQNITNLAVSGNPRFLAITYGSKDMIIYKQKNIEILDKKLKRNETENIGHIDLEIDKHYRKLFLKKPISLGLDPSGSNLCITHDDSSFLYSLIDNDIKEVFKNNSYCRACSYSKTGKYLALSYSENKVDYSIVLLDSNSLDIEYIFSHLPSYATKFSWHDDDKIFLALIEENNIIGYKLGDKRFITLKNLFKKTEKKDKDLVFKFTDFGEKIVDFAYDHLINYLIILSVDKTVKIFKCNKDDTNWDFIPNCRYTSVALASQIDVVFFGTSEGSIRSMIWPISNFTNKEQIDHPSFSEKFIHAAEVTFLVVSSDYKLVYSASNDGSIFISLLSIFSNDNPVSLQSLQYFNPKNVLPKKVHMQYSEFVNLTEQMYQDKILHVRNTENTIMKEKGDFKNELDKLIAEYDKTKDDLREAKDKEVKEERLRVKCLEDDNENLTKKILTQNNLMQKQFKEELFKIKEKYTEEKDNYQEITKNLSNLLKDVRANFNDAVNQIELQSNNDNIKFTEHFQRILDSMKIKSSKIDTDLEKKHKDYQNKIYDIEDKYEKVLIEANEVKNSEKDEILNRHKLIAAYTDKIANDNKNTQEKIAEWEKNLIDLQQNNTGLTESYLFNTLKLVQMSNLLNENEKLISNQEQMVKKKRETNDKLEQLRYVLEYQIKNLIKEKTPIEEQIRNFEALHSEFYKTFNLLYDEQMNIDDFTESNEKLISKFKEELSSKNKILYNLKNVYKQVELEINAVLIKRIEDKEEILTKLQAIKDRFLEEYKESDNLIGSSKESALQLKIIEREINKQKNKVLTELLNKRKQIKAVQEDKYDIIQKIQFENTMLIEECASIRNNLEEILKYISDIEKKFIELTNSHIFLQKMENAIDIKNNIKVAKQSIVLNEVNMRNINKQSSFERKCKIIITIVKKNQDDSRILKQLDENKDEIMYQNQEIERMNVNSI